MLAKPTCSPNLRQARLAISARCAWNLFNFRHNLLLTLQQQSAELITYGRTNGDFGPRLIETGIEFEPVPLAEEGISLTRDLVYMWDLYRRFRRRNPHLLHSYQIKPVIFGSLAAALAGVPLRIATITGLGYSFVSAGPVLRRVVEFLYRIALGRCHLVFFQNSSDRALFVERGLVSRDKSRLIPGSGVNLAQFNPEISRKLAKVHRDDRFTFVMFARLLAEKGVREYRIAAELLGGEYRDARFILVGGAYPGNPSGLTSKEISAIENSPTLEWIGETSDVRPYIACADVGVLPSYREGMSRALLEMGAMGKALITTDVPGCRDIVEDGKNGFLIPAKDAAALTGAMRRFLEDPQLAESMGAESHRLVSEQFDEAKVIDQTLAAYEQLLH